MSDLVNIKDERFWQILFDEACVEGQQAERIEKELKKITVEPVRGKWIPCSERLPEVCDDAEIELLISTHEAYPEVLFEESGFALYYPKTKSFHSVYGNRLEITEIVTAWQYLPEPYIRKKVEE